MCWKHISMQILYPTPGSFKENGSSYCIRANAKPAFDFYAAKDGEDLKVGKATIRFSTPGHTMESTCYLLKMKMAKR